MSWTEPSLHLSWALVEREWSLLKPAVDRAFIEIREARAREITGDK